LRVPIGPAGYFVANALAASNLANGVAVVADCVNPVEESRRDDKTQRLALKHELSKSKLSAPILSSMVVE